MWHFVVDYLDVFHRADKAVKEEAIIQELDLFSIDSIDDYFFFLRHLLKACLLLQNDLPKDKIRFLLKRANAYSVKEKQLSVSLLAWINLLTDTHENTPYPIQCAQGAVDDFAVPNPKYLTELAGVWGILGICLNCDLLKQSSLKLCEWIAHFFDRDQNCFSSLWVKESDHHSHFALIYKWVKSICEQINSKETPSSNLFIDSDFGFAKKISQLYSAVCSLGGCNTGLGAFHKRNVKIINLGPQRGSLGDISSFGIYRTCGFFSDVSLKEQNEQFSLKGWVALQPIDHLDRAYLETEIFSSQNGIDVKVRLERYNLEEKISFVFFVCSKTVEVFQNKRLYPLSLDRFIGESQKVQFESDGDQVFVEPLQKQDMQIIPLAGGKHFWGADFLLSFNLTSQRKFYSWKVY